MKDKKQILKIASWILIITGTIFIITSFVSSFKTLAPKKKTETTQSNQTNVAVPKTDNTTSKKIPKFSKNKVEQIIPTTHNLIAITINIDTTSLHLTPVVGGTLYDALVQAKESGQITFAGTNYSGLGFFITGINDLKSENGKNLIYYINGKVASVGVSSYTPKDGDVIDWKLE